MLNVLKALKLPIFVVGLIVTANLGAIYFGLFLGVSYLLYMYFKELDRLKGENKK